VPATYTFGESEVVPVAAGTTLPLKAYVVDK